MLDVIIALSAGGCLAATKYAVCAGYEEPHSPTAPLLHGMHGQARRHFTRQRVLDLELVQGQREHDLGSEMVLESIVIRGRPVIGLSLVMPNLAVLAEVGDEAGLRSPVGALAFDVEVLGGIRLLDPALRPC